MCVCERARDREKGDGGRKRLLPLVLIPMAAAGVDKLNLRASNSVGVSYNGVRDAAT